MLLGLIATEQREDAMYDVVYTQEELDEEEDIMNKRELRALKRDMQEGGKKLTVNQLAELEKGPALSPKDRLKRWEEMLEEARSR
ncbi:unnamed protein product [Symbiodinium sp. CCMP2592]|nr:unnamed protein product [Symbiodinium sp. CCMP2592]